MLTQRPYLDEDVPCPNCGYNLRGLKLDGTCPECGRESVGAAIAYQQHAGERRFWRNLIVTFCAAALLTTSVLLGIWPTSSHPSQIEQIIEAGAIIVIFAGTVSWFRAFRLVLRSAVRMHWSRPKLIVVIIALFISSVFPLMVLLIVLGPIIFVLFHLLS